MLTHGTLTERLAKLGITVFVYCLWNYGQEDPNHYAAEAVRGNEHFKVVGRDYYETRCKLLLALGLEDDFVEESLSRLSEILKTTVL